MLVLQRCPRQRCATAATRRELVPAVLRVTHSFNTVAASAYVVKNTEIAQHILLEHLFLGEITFAVFVTLFSAGSTIRFLAFACDRSLGTL